MPNCGSRDRVIHLNADIYGQDYDYFTCDDPRRIRRANTVQILINHGADVAAADMTQRTPLHIASSSRNVDIVPNLIKHGADVNAQNEFHSTPLHLASYEESLSIVRRGLLVEYGADVTAQDWNHKTPLHLVSSWVNSKPASLLI